MREAVALGVAIIAAAILAGVCIASTMEPLPGAWPLPTP